jgi:hypothetical protein
VRFVKRPLNWALIFIALVSIGAILLGQEDETVRKALCTQISCEQHHALAGLKRVAYDLGSASLVSLFFYWLVVRLPENATRHRIRESFALHFQQFKEDTIGTILAVTDGSYEWGLQRELTDQKKFKEYFKEKDEDGNERWYAFHNNMTDYYLKELQTHLEVLRSEILFTMAAVDIDDREVLEFMKRFSANIIRYRNVRLDDDSMKSFGSFMYEIFAGFSLVEGYMKRDYFKDMINDI